MRDGFRVSTGPHRPPSHRRMGFYRAETILSLTYREMMTAGLSQDPIEPRGIDFRRQYPFRRASLAMSHRHTSRGGIPKDKLRHPYQRASLPMSHRHTSDGGGVKLKTKPIIPTNMPHWPRAASHNGESFPDKGCFLRKRASRAASRHYRLRCSLGQARYSRGHNP